MLKRKYVEIKCDCCGLQLSGHTTLDCIKELGIQVMYGKINE